MLHPLPEMIIAAQRWRVTDSDHKKKKKKKGRYSNCTDTYCLPVNETQEKNSKSLRYFCFPFNHWTCHTENKSSDKLTDICYIKGSWGRWKCIVSHDHSIWGPKQWGKHNTKQYTCLTLLQGCTSKVVYVSFWAFKLSTLLHKELTTALKQVTWIIEKWHIFENMRGFCSKKPTSHPYKNFYGTFWWSNTNNH